MEEENNRIRNNFVNKSISQERLQRLKSCPHYVGGVENRGSTLKTHQMFLHEFTWLNVISPSENEKSVFSNSSGLKSLFKKLRFRDGLVWTTTDQIKIKLRLRISAASEWDAV